MPLSHGKSKKAFEHNIKTEYEAGKPLKQSLAIAYAMKRKKKKMSKGGETEGVHSSGGFYPGRSEAGEMVRDANESHKEKHMELYDSAKGEHEEKLRQLKSMKKPNLYADGGDVDQQTLGSMIGYPGSGPKPAPKPTPRQYAEGGDIKGVHPSAGKFANASKGDYSQEGQSMAGSAARGGHEWSNQEHRRVLNEMKSMKKPNLYAEGGKIGSGSQRKDNELGVHQSFVPNGGQSMTHQKLKPAFNLGKGFSEAEAKEEHMNRLEELRSMKKPNLMAHGGYIGSYQSSGKPEIDGDLDPEAHKLLELKNEFVSHPDSHDSHVAHQEFNQMGDEDEGAGDMDSIHPMVMRIMMGRAKGYSHGGEVANTDEDLAKEMPNEFDDLALDDDLEFKDTGANSGDEDDDAAEDHDREDIVSRIMKSRAKKDRMPRPA